MISDELQFLLQNAGHKENEKTFVTDGFIDWKNILMPKTTILRNKWLSLQKNVSAALVYLPS